MIRINFRFWFTGILAGLLVACGGGNGDKPQTQTGPVVAFDTQVLGAWVPQNEGNDTYEFYAGPTENPVAVVNTGRVYRNKKLIDIFSWAVQTNGALKLSSIGTRCATRPITLCAPTGTTTIVANGNSINHGKWTFEHDDNGDGIIDRRVSDVFDRKEIDLTFMPQGEFFLSRSDTYAVPFQGKIEGRTISLRMVDSGKPVWLSATMPLAKGRSLRFESGEAFSSQANATFNVTGLGARQFPVKSWYENVELSSTATGGFILEFETRKKVLIPADISPALVNLGTTEVPVKKSRSLIYIDKFTTGAPVELNQVYDTFLSLDFSPVLVNASAGTEVKFTSATQGTFSHTDHNKGIYTESRNFTWVQNTDGSLTLDFGKGIRIGIRFIKAISGGYQVLFSIPSATLGTDYLIQDWIKEQPSTLTEADAIGTYVFVGGDGITENIVTLHADKTISGVAGGFWFIDANKDVVSYECYNKANKLLSRYEECEAGLNDTSTISFVHIRRLKFMYKNGTEYEVKYNANLWGTRSDGFGGISTKNYYGLNFIYRFNRTGS